MTSQSTALPTYTIFLRVLILGIGLVVTVWQLYINGYVFPRTDDEIIFGFLPRIAPLLLALVYLLANTKTNIIAGAIVILFWLGINAYGLNEYPGCFAFTTQGCGEAEGIIIGLFWMIPNMILSPGLVAVLLGSLLVRAFKNKPVSS